MNWDNLIHNVGRRSAKSAALLRRGVFCKFSNGFLIVGFGDSRSVSEFKRNQVSSVIREASGGKISSSTATNKEKYIRGAFEKFIKDEGYGEREIIIR